MPPQFCLAQYRALVGQNPILIGDAFYFDRGFEEFAIWGTAICRQRHGPEVAQQRDVATALLERAWRAIMGQDAILIRDPTDDDTGLIGLAIATQAGRRNPGLTAQIRELEI